MNDTPLINRAKVKSLALAAAQQRARKFTRVGKDFYAAINQATHQAVLNRVANHPSVGVTLK